MLIGVDSIRNNKKHNSLQLFSLCVRIMGCTCMFLIVICLNSYTSVSIPVILFLHDSYSYLYNQIHSFPCLQLCPSVANAVNISYICWMKHEWNILWFLHEFSEKSTICAIPFCTIKVAHSPAYMACVWVMCLHINIVALHPYAYYIDYRPTYLFI